MTKGPRVVEYQDRWVQDFAWIRDELSRALAAVPHESIEHVGSTSVPGLAAKPVIDVDVIVLPAHVSSAIAALVAIGYRHQGDLGLEGREAFKAPDEGPRRHVYVCVAGSLHLRNHLAVRDVLRRRPDLRDAYAETKLSLVAQPGLEMASYIVGKSAILQRVLDESDLTPEEKAAIHRINRGA